MSRKGGPERTDAQRAADQLEIARRYCKGERQASIAVALGMTQAQVSRDLAVVVRQWQAEALHDLDAHKAAELARIDSLEREYWAAWEASKGQASRSTQSGTTVPDGKQNRITATVVVEERTGDPRYLAGVQWCIERRCKLLGLDAPTKQDVTSGGKVLDFAALMLAAQHAAE
jgi:hypothetical protein